MSLARLCLRLSAVRALRGATLAKQAVYDSGATLDQLLADERVPVLIVYTDEQRETPTGRADMGRGQTGCDLVIEMAITGVATATDGSVVAEVAEADAGQELLLDLLERQVMLALTAGQGVWPDLFKTFAVSFGGIISRRAMSEAGAVRYAARQLVITCDLLIDPLPGAVFGPDSAWGRFMAAVGSDPALAPILPTLQAALAGQPLTPLEAAARTLGLQEADAAALGLGGLPDDPAAVLSEGSPDISVTIGSGV